MPGTPGPTLITQEMNEGAKQKAILQRSLLKTEAVAVSYYLLRMFSTPEGRVVAVYLVLLITFPVIVVVGFVAHSQVIRLLRSQHPETWMELGCPTLFTHSKALTKFILYNKFKAVSDERLHKLAALDRNLRVTSYFLIVALLFAGMLLRS